MLPGVSFYMNCLLKEFVLARSRDRYKCSCKVSSYHYIKNGAPDFTLTIAIWMAVIFLSVMLLLLRISVQILVGIYDILNEIAFPISPSSGYC